MIKGVILDLDGTVYWGDEEVAGAGRFVALMKDKNIRCMFVTNRANRTPAQIREQLNKYGILCEDEDVLTSAEATVQYLKQGSVFYIGEEGMRQAIEKSSLTINENSPDYVIVSYDRFLTKEKLDKACRLIRQGAKFLLTNPDKGLVTETGILPGTGSIAEAVTEKCGIKPVVIGKPEKLIIEMAVERLGMKPDEVLLVGDNVETDIPAGQKAGVRTVLLLTGISSREDLKKSAMKPTWIAQNYAELERIILG